MPSLAFRRSPTVHSPKCTIANRISQLYQLLTLAVWWPRFSPS